ncbi:hypothetical protein [Flammeovirga sp. OC4]|nr:hypothetical protein [Flammeovirga sp. OC4]
MTVQTAFLSVVTVNALPNELGRKSNGTNIKREHHSCPTDHQKSLDF